MSQYEKSQVENEAMIGLTWHGEPTMVLFDGDEAKTDVATGATVKVTASQAKKLLSYSPKWTLKGDEPVVHGYEEANRKALALRDAKMRERVARKSGKKADAPAATVDGDKKPEIDTLTEEDVEAMTNKKDVVAALRMRAVKANKEATIDELKSLLKDTLAEASKSTEPTPATPAEGEAKKE